MKTGAGPAVFDASAVLAHLLLEHGGLKVKSELKAARVLTADPDFHKLATRVPVTFIR